MRLTFATIVLVGLPALVLAQSAGPAHRQPSSPSLPSIGLPLPSITFPLPSITSPLPSITSPLPSIGLPPMGSSDRRFDGRGSRRSRLAPAAVFFVPSYIPSYYGWGVPPQPLQPAPPPPSEPSPPAIAPEPPPTTGRLRLELKPAVGLQFFADGYYLGTSDDVNGELELETGPHSIEIRAPGYDTLSFDVKISAGRSITYRGALKPADGAVTPEPVAPAARTTFYYIPGCYMGNVPPEDVALPPTCDLTRLVTRKP